MSVFKYNAAVQTTIPFGSGPFVAPLTVIIIIKKKNQTLIP